MTEPTEPVVALVVAAGSGVRLGGEVPKALREIAGRPLVLRSVEQLAGGGCTHAVVVVAAGTEDAFAAALASAPVPVRLVRGGAERQDSVRLGLDAVAADPSLAGCRVVLVHDAARALVPAAVVARVIAAVQGGAPAVIPVTTVIDSVRQVLPGGSSVVDRATLRAVQTPQGFDLATLRAAHELIARDGVAVTDDAAACEHAGHSVVLVEGAREAMKITEPLDLVLAEAIARADV
ncbi:2-C-methyl-D-erythritol 4-phosphate cytidylyltransferase [Propioniciclava tarda]|uniref:2-C-methyl-D-erythritol 4-phosphate cytidylyltransferase n=1 Tax=Propioniciclava tarda TaxID=433330 RepID=A0A4Q9KJL3_PROTD|nr:2-C-methyl-D-erythritol 4-phosphate cytidylyltransferase [Propioniciclava tarda]TBT94637.1 2-C-methyl-D-erythritol 4-phosphate cytidylyltransferase [Propioniciclava tarda]SMO66876.1 2-C-methyl-D-erythritol 4-phosphate cytidylyltransferase [Propioniciclava tarda]